MILSLLSKIKNTRMYLSQMRWRFQSCFSTGSCPLSAALSAYNTNWLSQACPICGLCATQLCGPPLSCTIIAASLQHWAAQPAPKHQPYVLLTPSGLKLGHRAQCGASSNYGKYGLGWTQFCEQRRVCSCAFYFDTRIWEKVSRLKKKKYLQLHFQSI